MALINRVFRHSSIKLALYNILLFCVVAFVVLGNAGKSAESDI